MKRLKLFLIFLMLSSSIYSQTNTFPASGNVGIGTTNPSANISFKNVDATSDANGITWYSSSPLNYGIHRTSGSWDAPDFQQLRLSWSTGILLDPGNLYGKSYVDIRGGGLRVTFGNVGIGTVDTRGYKLAVAGNILAESIKVQAQSAWPDYVFTKNYQPLSLQEIEKHIKDKGHLPGIPSAEEVKANGVDLGEMNAKLLQKIEELTLYLIEMKKENDEERLNNRKQEEIINKLEKDIKYLKSN